MYNQYRKSRSYYRTRIKIKIKDCRAREVYMYDNSLDTLCDIKDFKRVKINTYDYQWIKYYETVQIYTNRGDLDVYL